MVPLDAAAAASLSVVSAAGFVSPPAGAWFLLQPTVVRATAARINRIFFMSDFKNVFYKIRFCFVLADFPYLFESV